MAVRKKNRATVCYQDTKNELTHRILQHRVEANLMIPVKIMFSYTGYNKSTLDYFDIGYSHI